MTKTDSDDSRVGLDRELRDVLERYLSHITVEAVLNRVYAEERLRPDRLTYADLERVYQSSLFASVRMFCKPERLSDAMMDLAELMEPFPERGER